MNVGKVKIENVFENLKNKLKTLHCINAHVDQIFKIMMGCCVLHMGALDLIFLYISLKFGPQVYVSKLYYLMKFGPHIHK